MANRLHIFIPPRRLHHQSGPAERPDRYRPAVVPVCVPAEAGALGQLDLSDGGGDGTEEESGEGGAGNTMERTRDKRHQWAECDDNLHCLVCK